MLTVKEFGARGIGFRDLDEDRVETLSDPEVASLPEGSLALPELLSRFDPVSLAEMDQVALLNRTDTKYVMGLPHLYSALTSLADRYRVLEINGTRLNRYRSIYFDTSDFALYRHHHSGRRLRYKVRSRQYLDSQQSFFEVKRKVGGDRTVKERLRTTCFVTHWVPDLASLINSRAPGEVPPLEPKLSNEFYRITLVSNHCRERVTLDLGLRFHARGRSAALPGVVIAEVKQERVNRSSDFMRHTRGAGLRPSAFSKYCIGVSMLYKEVRHNRFKPELRLIGRLMESHYDA